MSKLQLALSPMQDLPVPHKGQVILVVWEGFAETFWASPFSSTGWYWGGEPVGLFDEMHVPPKEAVGWAWVYK